MSTLSSPGIATPPMAPGIAAPPGPIQTPIKVRLPVFINEQILIPEWVVDHDSYRRWAKSDDFPTRGRFSFIDGIVWVDLFMEQFFSHSLIKTEYGGVLAPLVKSAKTGYFATDGNLWTHPEAGISTEPDSLFFTYESLKSGRIRLIEGKTEGYVELEGSLDMLLEIVSDSSVKKDTQVLKDKCAKAGVREYWLVDARGEKLRFDIFRLRDGQYEATPNVDGWLASKVFAKDFKLQQDIDQLGHPRFELLVR